VNSRVYEVHEAIPLISASNEASAYVIVTWERSLLQFVRAQCVGISSVAHRTQMLLLGYFSAKGTTKGSGR